MKKILRPLIVLFAMTTLCSIGGVNAIWHYAGGGVEGRSVQQNLMIEDFYYAENVPDDNKEELSHNALLMKIISDVDGLNNPNSLLSQAVRKRFDNNYDTVSSNQQVSGGNLKNTFSNIEGFENVGFLIVYVEEDEYYIYTYDNRDTQSTGKTIDTYLTHIHKSSDGVWYLAGGYEGTAETCVYDGQTTGKYKNTIDPTTYQRKNA